MGRFTNRAELIAALRQRAGSAAASISAARNVGRLWTADRGQPHRADLRDGRGAAPFARQRGGERPTEPMQGSCMQNSSACSGAMGGAAHAAQQAAAIGTDAVVSHGNGGANTGGAAACSASGPTEAAATWFLAVPSLATAAGPRSSGASSSVASAEVPARRRLVGKQRPVGHAHTSTSSCALGRTSPAAPPERPA